MVEVFEDVDAKHAVEPPGQTLVEAGVLKVALNGFQILQMTEPLPDLSYMTLVDVSNHQTLPVQEVGSQIPHTRPGLEDMCTEMRPELLHCPPGDSRGGGEALQGAVTGINR